MLRTSKRWSWCVWAIALTIGVKVVCLALDSHPYFLLGDSAVYLEESLSLHPGLARPLGYAVFLRFLLGIFHSIRAVLIVQTFMALAASLLFFRIVCDRFRSRALAAGTLIVLALWPWTTFFERTILAETLAFLFLALTFFLLLKRRKVGVRFLAGGCLGLGVLTRSVLSCLVPIGLLWILWKDRREKSPWIRSAVAYVLGLFILIGPYATGTRLISGDWGIVHFDGWSLFGLTGGWTDVQEIRDPEVREVFLASDVPLSALSPGERMWSATSPVKGLLRHYHAKTDRVPIPREQAIRQLRSGDVLGLAQQALSRPPTEWVMANRALRKIALQTVLAHPGKYCMAVIRGMGIFFLGGGEHRWYFQNPDSAEHPYAVVDKERLESLGQALRVWNTDFVWPQRPAGLALDWAYLAYGIRSILLVLPLAGLVRLRGRLLGREEFFLGVVFALALASATSAVSEVYDRYTVLITPLLIFLNAVVVDEWTRKRNENEKEPR